MGERTSGLNGSSRASIEELGSEIASVREELDTLLGELDRRRHEALDMPLQLRRHARGVSVAAASVVAVVTAGVWMAASRRRRRRRWPDRWQDQAEALRHAFSRMTAHPERVAVESNPSLVRKLLAAAATAAVASLVKKVLERGISQAMDAAPAPPPVARRQPTYVAEEAI
jgi:hypothetical protein